MSRTASAQMTPAQHQYVRDVQKWAERDSKRGTHRDVYQLLNRTARVSPAHRVKGVLGCTANRRKPDWAVVQTKDGPKKADRLSLAIQREEMTTVQRQARARRRGRAGRKQRQRQRRLARR